ncbi:unnamed protein product, partial [Vitis vinifera]
MLLFQARCQKVGEKSFLSISTFQSEGFGHCCFVKDNYEMTLFHN